MIIYKITNMINNKIYIGKSKNFEARKERYIAAFNWHKTKNVKSKQMVVNKMVKHGIENFKFEIIDTASNEEELNEKEIYYISTFNSTNRKIGYNISTGGDGGDTLTNHPDRENICKKISQKISGANNGIHTLKKDPIKFEAWRKKNSDSNSGGKNGFAKAVLKIDEITGKIVERYDYSKEAALMNNIKYTTLCGCKKTKKPINGFYYVNENEYNKV